jgi:hypothetical protein
MEKILDPNDRLTGRSAVGAELSAELATLLRSGRSSLQHVQSGFTKVLSLEPLTTVKDLIIIGEGPAAEEIFQYCEIRPYEDIVFAVCSMTTLLKVHWVSGV